MKKHLLRLLQLLILGGCFAYLAYGVDLKELATAFSGYSSWAIVGVFAITLPNYLLFGLRLNRLTGGGISLFTGTKGFLLGCAFNNILPARLGEVSKAVYFKQMTSLNLPQSMGIIFLERFLDINLLALLTLCAALVFGLGMIGLPLLALVALCWVGLFIVIHRMKAGPPELGFIIWPKVRDFIRSLLVSIEQAIRERPIMVPLAFTACIWLINFAYVAAIALWLGDLNLTWGQTFALFATVFIGISIPGTPGGLGVAEGAIVALLSLYGVSKPEAIALALTIRAFNFLPPTTMGLLVFAKAGLDKETIVKTQAAGE